jgi:hypothetical protein
MINSNAFGASAPRTEANASTAPVHFNDALRDCESQAGAALLRVAASSVEEQYACFTTTGSNLHNLTLRTPIRSYAVIWPDGFVYRPGMRSSRWHTHAGGFYLGDSQCVNATRMWLASLYASKERKTRAPKAKSKAG